MAFSREDLWAARLALVNSVGFSATTIMPLWVAALPGAAGVAGWVVGLVATLQLAACALGNLAAPWLVRSADSLWVARRMVLLAALAELVQAVALSSVVASFPLFAVAAIVSGGALGITLTMTNRIMAGSDHVQKGYAIFQLVEVCLASSLYLASATCLQHFGVPSVFVGAASVALVSLLALRRLSPPASSALQSRTARPGATRRGALLLAVVIIFFAGQSSINSFVIPIGQRVGLDAVLVARIVAGGMVSGFFGAMAARWIGGRAGLAAPIVATGLALAADFLLLAHTSSWWLFATAAALIPSGTIFVVPYFFTALAEADRGGRLAAIAPAFLIGGVSLGPIIATGISGALGVSALGWVASFLVVGAVLLFALILAQGRTGSDTRSFDTQARL